MLISDEGSGRDLRFDEFLMLGAAETKAVVNLVAQVLDGGRKRARKATETEGFDRTVGLVIANAVMGGEDWVHYSRRYETYSGASPYNPAWLGSKRLLGVIDGLSREGLVRALCGRWGGVFSKGLESAFKATPPLIEKLRALGIDHSAVQRDWANAPVMVLKDTDDRLIRYDPTDELVVKRSGELRAYNAFVASQDISLTGNMGSPPFRGLTRIYNDGSWERGGRHYGGWWQSVPSVQRSNLLINGEETVELDFGGFNPRALYHLTGQGLRGEDPYDIPKIKRVLEERGIDWETKGRPAVKTMVNIAISAKSKSAFFTSESMKQISLPEDVIKYCVPVIIEHHAPIGQHLLKGRSLELMNIESDICQNIICDGMKDGIAILPIYDSFLIQIKYEDRLRDDMISVYRNRLGYCPSIH